MEVDRVNLGGIYYYNLNKIRDIMCTVLGSCSMERIIESYENITCKNIILQDYWIESDSLVRLLKWYIKTFMRLAMMRT